MKRPQRGFTTIELFITIIGLLAIGGWVANIVKLTHLDFALFSGWLILRAIGIVVPPFGAILGFL